jgi:uncharacterized protein YbjQ (UPF0145 family)
VDAITAAAFELAFPLLLLLGTYLIGSAVERAHYRDLRIREWRSRRLLTVNLRTPPKGWKITGAELVTGSVVISIDHFRRLLAGLRMLFGGRIPAYERLLDRARREAVLRMKEAAFERGCQAVINVRIETSKIASSRRNGEGTAGAEILAFGTALKLAK